MSRKRNGLEVGSDQRRKAGSIQKLFQEKRRTGEARCCTNAVNFRVKIDVEISVNFDIEINIEIKAKVNVKINVNIEY